MVGIMIPREEEGKDHRSKRLRGRANAASVVTSRKTNFADVEGS